MGRQGMTQDDPARDPDEADADRGGPGGAPGDGRGIIVSDGTRDEPMDDLWDEAEDLEADEEAAAQAAGADGRATLAGLGPDAAADDPVGEDAEGFLPPESDEGRA